MTASPSRCSAERPPGRLSSVRPKRSDDVSLRHLLGAECRASVREPTVGAASTHARIGPCRWHDLPDLYSHYGSRGIVLMTILQSWSQGVQVWGRDGMRKLWSASNIAVYGGGVKEPEFLNELSQMVRDYDKHTMSTSVGRGNRSTSHQVQRERTVDIADLGALPRGRAVVFASGAPATLVETVPWMRGPHADAVRASIKAHDPSARAAATVPSAADAWITAAPTKEDKP
ncbi:type IV secretory system conjugative DNA transfer family protein [Mycetocola zhadangensis]|uniref:type IV secretory system conjugative DNA transfer family protein n=1 Tax=Mycetocola zhadangensis TaxID=1164595 RepID=UPI003A4DECDC